MERLAPCFPIRIPCPFCCCLLCVLSAACCLFMFPLAATIRDSSIMYVRTAAALGIGLLVGTMFFGLKDDEEVRPATRLCCLLAVCAISHAVLFGGPQSSGPRTAVLEFVMCVFSLFCLPAIR